MKIKTTTLASQSRTIKISLSLDHTADGIPLPQVLIYVNNQLMVNSSRMPEPLTDSAEDVAAAAEGVIYKISGANISGRYAYAYLPTRWADIITKMHSEMSIEEAKK